MQLEYVASVVLSRLTFRGFGRSPSFAEAGGSTKPIANVTKLDLIDIDAVSGRSEAIIGAHR